MNQEIRISIAGLVYNQTIVGTYGLVLSEMYGNRRFSVMIGEPEAQSIALKINKKKSPRPLTHDLINNILNTFESKLTKVLIYDMVNDVFFSELHITKPNGDLIVIDARTSDAVALAVRTDCPMFIKSEILEIVGTVVEDESDNNDPAEESNVNNSDLESMSVSGLEELLSKTLNEENYEQAVLIRDIINRKKNTNS